MAARKDSMSKKKLSKEELKGKQIVITRSFSAGGEWKKYLEAHGAVVHAFPTIDTVSVEPTRRMVNTLKRMSDFDWIIFTSAAAPYFLRDLVKKIGMPLVPAQKMPSIAVVGEKTGESVHALGYRTTFTPLKFGSKMLAQKLGFVRGSRILLLRANIASDDLPKALKARGAAVTELGIYKTNIIRRPAELQFKKLLMTGAIDYITFASPSAVRGFAARVKEEAFKAAQRIPVIAMGSGISAALKQLEFKKIRLAKSPTIEGLADSMLR